MALASSSSSHDVLETFSTTYALFLDHLLLKSQSSDVRILKIDCGSHLSGVSPCRPHASFYVWVGDDSFRLLRTFCNDWKNEKSFLSWLNFNRQIPTGYIASGSSKRGCGGRACPRCASIPVNHSEGKLQCASPNSALASSRSLGCVDDTAPMSNFFLTTPLAMRMLVSISGQSCTERELRRWRHSVNTSLHSDRH